MILITGATGNLGGVVIQTLLQQLPANEIAALVRDPAKASALEARGVSVRVGEYDDIPSVEAAMRGVDKVLLISGGNAPNLVEQHQNVVTAAKRAGVQCLAYTGRIFKDRATLASAFMDTHYQTDDIVMASGMNYTLFRNNLYMDSLLWLVGPNATETGINLPTGDGKVAFALRSDMGEAMANVLAGQDGDNRIYHFTGARAYSFEEVAAALSDLTGKTVRYNPLTSEAYLAQLKAQGTPEEVAGHVLDSMIDIKNGQSEEVSDDLERALGRKPTGLKEGLKTLFKL